MPASFLVPNNIQIFSSYLGTIAYRHLVPFMVLFTQIRDPTH